jgi:hypothetical protein
MNTLPQDFTAGSGDLTNTWVIAAVAVALAAVLLLWFILSKGRKMPGEHVFRASRLSKGNRLFPTQVVISTSSVTHYTPQWIGKLEASIHISHVSSIKIDTNILFSDVAIETTGGHNPVVCHGHSKGDAIEMKRLIEEFQSAFYRRRTDDGSPET